MSLVRIFKTVLLASFLYSCAEYNLEKVDKKAEKKYFSSSGFALIYDDDHFSEKIVNKKINNEEIRVLHNILKPNTPIKIINPENSKILETKVYKKAKYPNIFNVVISRKISSILELDSDNPFVELLEVKKNKTFVAKKSNTFEEERNVAENAPVKEIKMDDLTKSKPIKKTKKINNFILVISDFYYFESATSLKNELIQKTEINNFSIKKINENKYRLFVGPFKNFNALKTSYISLNKLGFENLNIYRD